MTAILLKTKAEQKLEWFDSLHRPLTDAESEDLRRTMHAVYARRQHLNAIAQQRKEELELLKRLRKEAKMPSRLS